MTAGRHLSIGAKAAKAVVVFVVLAVFLVLAYHAVQILFTWSSRQDILLSLFLVVAAVFYGLTRVVSFFGKRVLLFLWSILRSIFSALGANPDVQRIARRYPRASGWIGRRLNYRTFSGLPLTLLTVSFVYVAVPLAGTVYGVICSSAVVAADQGVAALLDLFRAPWAVSAFVWITALGDLKFIFTAALCLVGLLWVRKRTDVIVAFLVGLMGSAVSAEALKLIIRRPRPEFGVLIEGSFSFPSGHATLSVAFYGFLAYLAWKGWRSWRRRFDVFFAAVAVVALVGFSRLYLGVHYLSDVWGGFLLGTLWLIVAVGLAEWKAFRTSLRAAPVQGRSRRWAGIAAFALAAFGFALTVALEERAPAVPEPAPSVQVVSDANLVVFDDAKLPRFSETVSAQPQEPISLIVLAADDRALIAAFHEAGWFLADQITAQTVSRLMGAAIVGGTYDTAPMTPSFWNGTVHDFGFEKPAGSGGVRQRHHARFWKTAYRTVDGQAVYIGTASLDIGLKWFVTHRIAPDIDTERAFLVKDLLAAGVVGSSREADFIPPILGKNFTRDAFFTDGQVEILKLK